MLRHAIALILFCSTSVAALAETAGSNQASLLAQNSKAAPKFTESRKQGDSKAPKAETPASKADELKGSQTADAQDKDFLNLPERRPECMWTGQRIVSLLSRDDINTAREHMNFYDRFGCPREHITVAFRCAIRQAERQPQQTDISARVYGCWMSPDLGESESVQPVAPATEPSKPQPPAQ